MLYDRVLGFSLIWNDMCLRLSPVVRYTGVCLVIWDDTLGTQNFPKQIRWCNSVWSVCGALRRYLHPFLWGWVICVLLPTCRGRSSGRRAYWFFSLEDVIFSLQSLGWSYFSDCSFLMFVTWQSTARLLMLSKWDEREEGRLEGGEWHKKSLSYLLKDEILSVQPGCNFLQLVQKGDGGGITPRLSFLLSELHKSSTILITDRSNKSRTV